jgi:sporulation integral membrane protein YtvI
MRQIPERPAGILRDIKRYLGVVILQFVRSYAIILLVTFSELAIGFAILGVKNVFLLALLISLFDILPVVGLGAVLLPWAAISLVTGNTALGIGLVVMYVVILVVRNIIEPKIVGDRVGLHPLLTLVCMFVGAKLFGVIGLFGLPVAVAILKALNDKGAIRLYKRGG